MRNPPPRKPLKTMEVTCIPMQTRDVQTLMSHEQISKSDTFGRKQAEIRAKFHAGVVGGRHCMHEYRPVDGDHYFCDERAVQNGEFPHGFLCYRHNLEMLRRRQSAA